MAPPVRFTVTTVIIAVIIVIVASIPFASFRLVQHSLPYAGGRPHILRSLVDSGAGSFDARFLPAAIVTPASGAAVRRDLIAPYSSRTLPLAEAGQDSVVPPSVKTSATVDTDITGAVQPTKTVEPIAAPAAKALAVAPAATPAPADSLPSKTKTATVTLAPPKAEAADKPPAAADSPPGKSKTATVTPAAPKAEAVAKPPVSADPPLGKTKTATVTSESPKAEAVAKPSEKKKEVVKRRVRSRRARVRSRNSSRNATLNPFEALFGLGR